MLDPCCRVKTPHPSKLHIKLPFAPLSASSLPPNKSQKHPTTMEPRLTPPTNLSPSQVTSSPYVPEVYLHKASLTLDIADAPIGPRSTLYTEPSFLKDCQYEFSADTESFISIAEKLVIPYEWSTYDVLVLPKSFPYGGMENPNLTTVTPTLIAGDRSNVDVVAHEASHSWSGNLVTNATWEDFWLNEGTSPPNAVLISRMDGVFGTKDHWTNAWKRVCGIQRYYRMESTQRFGGTVWRGRTRVHSAGHQTRWERP